MRKILCIILICLLCSSFVYAVDSENVVENTTNTTSNTTSLQDKQKEIEGQIEQANEELSGIQLDITENLEQVQKLDEKIENAEAELAENSEKIQILQQTIQGLEESQKIEKEKYDKQRKIFEERIVALYEAGDTQYLDVLLKCDNVSDFVSTYFVISEIADYDADILNTIGERKNNIENAKIKLEKERAELATIVEKQTRTSKVLQTTKKLRENYISKLSEQEKETQSKIDEYNQALKEINMQIIELAKGGIDTVYIGGELAWPVPGYTKISSKYGMRVHPITKVYKLHTGVDISAPMGANFVAANDGIVTKAGYNSAYGNMVLIDHGGGISTLYAHGSKILVQVGDKVTRNQAILKVGSTGYSTGPHAHFEVRKNGIVTDPMPYITNGLVPNSEEDKEQTEQSKQEDNNTQDQNTSAENTSN